MLTSSSWPGLGRELYDTLAELRKRDPRCRRTLRRETELRHPRQGVGFETVEGPVLGHSEINARTAAQLECPECGESLALCVGRLRFRQLRRKFLLGHPLRVLALVVVDLVLRLDLADGQRLVAKDRHRELASGDEALDHHLVIVPERLLDRGAEILALLHEREADRRPLLARLDDHRKPELAFDC